MAFLTAQLDSFMEVDATGDLLEEDQTLVADLITASMDVDSQEKEDPPFAGEIDLADDGFENPFLNFDAEFPLEAEVQSLQAEFAQAAGHFGAEAGFGGLAVVEAEFGGFADADSAGEAGFGGFADPALGWDNQGGLVEELPVRLRRAEGGRYGFEIVVRSGRAYPAGANLDPLQREEHPWQGDQLQQQGEFGVREELGVNNVFRGGFRGVVHGAEAPLVGGDPVEGVGERERPPQEQDNSPGDGFGRTDGGIDYAYRVYRDSMDRSDRQDDRFERPHFDDNLAAAAAAAVAATANRVVPGGALPRPPTQPVLHALTTTEPRTNTTSSGNLSSVSSHQSGVPCHQIGVPSHQSGVSSHQSGVSGYLDIVPSLQSGVSGHQSGVSSHLGGVSGHLGGVSGHLGGVSSHQNGVSSYRDPTLAVWGVIGEYVAEYPASESMLGQTSAESVSTMRGQVSSGGGRSHGHVSAAQAIELQIAGSMSSLGEDRPEIDARDFEQAALRRIETSGVNALVIDTRDFEQIALRQFEPAGVNAPVVEAAEERAERQRLGVVRGLVAHVAAAFDGASSRGDAVYIGGRGQDGLACQLASTAGFRNGSASSTSLKNNSAAKHYKALLRPKHASLKRKTTISATCQLSLPHLVAASASILVC